MTNPLREALAEARDMLPKVGEPENVWTMVKAPTLRALVGAIDELLETQRKFGTMMHEQAAEHERQLKFVAERWQIECERERDAAFNDGIEAAAKACMDERVADEYVVVQDDDEAYNLACTHCFSAIRALKRRDPSATQAELEDAADTLKALESMVPRGGIEPPTP
jgi:hypothetical protein